MRACADGTIGTRRIVEPDRRVFSRERRQEFGREARQAVDCNNAVDLRRTGPVARLPALARQFDAGKRFSRAQDRRIVGSTRREHTGWTACNAQAALHAARRVEVHLRAAKMNRVGWARQALIAAAVFMFRVQTRGGVHVHGLRVGRRDQFLDDLEAQHKNIISRWSRDPV